MKTLEIYIDRLWISINDGLRFRLIQADGKENSYVDFGVIFDWDGVIIDSSKQHEKSWELLAEEIGKPLTDGFFKQGFGMRSEVIIPDLLKWTAEAGEIINLSLRKEALYREILVDQPATPLPGVVNLLEALSNENVPCVVGSSTHRANIVLILEQFNISQYFLDIIAGEDVEQGKPHPEVFLQAAARMHHTPKKCIVYEDTPPGIEAARNARAIPIGVIGTHPPENLQRAAWLVHRLDEFSPRQLGKMVEQNLRHPEAIYGT